MTARCTCPTPHVLSPQSRIPEALAPRIGGATAGDFGGEESVLKPAVVRKCDSQSLLNLVVGCWQPHIVHRRHRPCPMLPTSAKASFEDLSGMSYPPPPLPKHGQNRGARLLGLRRPTPPHLSRNWPSAPFGVWEEGVSEVEPAHMRIKTISATWLHINRGKCLFPVNGGPQS